MQKFKFLLANGDSSMAGDETALSEFYPEFSNLYPCPSDPADYRQSTLRPAWNEEMTKDGRKHIEYIKKCLEYAYPAQLASLLDISSKNISTAGQANSVTAATTIGYIEEHLLDKYQPEEILVLVGVTTFDRLKIPKPVATNYNDIHSSYECKNIILSYQNKDVPDAVQNYFKTTSDTYLALENLIAILGLISYLETRKISYVLTEAALYSRWIRVVDLKFPDRFKELFYKIDEKLQFQNVLIPGEYIITEFNHYGKEAHVRFAHILHEYVQQKFL